MARLPIDAQLLCYYGLDETDETDVGIDESLGGNNLTIVSSPAVVPARIGNGRQFDGVATLGTLTPAQSAGIYAYNHGTIIVWFTLDSVNAGGDLLRPLVSLDGPTGNPSDNTVFAVSVDSQGRLVYRYDTQASGVVILKTAPAAIRVGRYYSLAIVQDFNNVNQTLVTAYLQNTPTPWASATVAGVPQGDPNGPMPGAEIPPIPTGNLTVGGSNKSASKWQGVVDELSIHSVARAVHPYLFAAYFRLTQALQFSRLTALGGIRNVASVEMGGGTRWWCYDRDQSVYVIRENTLGLFTDEVQLTTGGVAQPSGVSMPGGTEQPALAYDPVADALVVAFLAAGRIYRVTATAGDAPVTQNMPYTADTAGIIKVRDSIDYYRGGDGQPTVPVPQNPGAQPVGDNTPATTVLFLDIPSFGLVIEGLNAYGYAVYSTIAGGFETFLGTTITPDTSRYETSGNYHFFAIASRQYGRGYFARPLKRNGAPGLTRSNVVFDFQGDFVTVAPFSTATAPLYNHYGEVIHEHVRGGGGQPPFDRGIIGYVNRTPVKILVLDPVAAGDGQPAFDQAVLVYINRTPIKIPLLESAPLGNGGANRVTMQRTNGPRIDL